MSQKMDRRRFVQSASVAAAAAAATLAGCGRQGENSASGGAPAVHTRPKFQWKCVTTWPPRFPVIGESADKLAQWVDEMSAGRLKIRVYGGDELVPALEAFDNVRQGNVEMGHGASYYWAGKAAATQFFAAVPFGMNAQGMNAWLYSGGGLALWEKVYSDFGLIPMPVGNSGVQMGGWFNKPIRSMADFRGLKMRMPGLGGKVISRAGAAVTLLPGSEIYTSLERGVIDATEWVGPYHDYLMGFHKIARHYYYPGWHEPGTVIELFVNRKAWEMLDSDLQHIVRTAAWRSNLWMLSEFEAKNNEYLQKLVKEPRVQVTRFPDDVLAGLRTHTAEVIDELVSKDPMCREVYASFHSFRKQVGEWATASEKAYYDLIMGP